MSPELTGLAGFAAVLIIIMLRIPIGVSMGIVGIAGIWSLGGIDTVRYAVGVAPFNVIYPYSMSVLPLFIMMGVFAAYSGMSRKLFQTANAYIGHVRGGLAVATIGACAAFGAICGSSLATSATMAKVALPEMLRYGYDPRLAAGAVAAGGTLGIMIPPSLALALYGLLTQTSIGALYLAGILPGLLGALLYCGAIWYTTWRNPDSAPPAPRHSWSERLSGLVKIWDVVALFSLVLGGMFLGWFSPTEAAAVGVAGAVVIMILRRLLDLQSLKHSLWETATTMGSLVLILAGASVFSFFIDLSNLPQFTVAWVNSLTLSRMEILAIIIVAYLILGCLLDSMSMLLLTLPFVFPVVKSLGFDPVWFGILMVTVIEIGLIHPPFGMNLFVVQATAPSVSQGTIVRGVLPFIAADLLRTVLLVLFPAIALVLLP